MPKQTAFKHLQDQLKWVDLVFEVRDARVPRSSGHPNADQLFGAKPRVIVLAKADLADAKTIKSFITELTAEANRAAIDLCLKDGKGKDKLLKLAYELTAQKRQAHAAKGLLPRPVRACVVGMPNVGKSTFINWFVGQKRAAVGNRPGVTKGPQWIRVSRELELLDTPGVLPAFGLPKPAILKLGLFNLLPEDLYDLEEIAEQGLMWLAESKPEILEKYLPGLSSSKAPLYDLAKVRNCVSTGGKFDTRKAATIFLSDLRNGRLGRVTAETPSKRSIGDGN